MFRQQFFLKSRGDLLGKIVRNFKRKSKKVNGDNDLNEEADEAVMLQKVYSKLEQIRSEQDQLETMVDVLEQKSEKIDLYTQNFFTTFYQKYIQTLN